MSLPTYCGEVAVLIFSLRACVLMTLKVPPNSRALAQISRLWVRTTTSRIMGYRDFWFYS